MSKIAKTVVITGASSGFGEESVKAFADQGYRVWGTMRDLAGRNSNKKAELEAYSPKVSIIEMNVAEDATVEKAFTQILNQGPVDILINNAGIMYLGAEFPIWVPGDFLKGDRPELLLAS